MTSSDILARYDASRDPEVDRSILCHAPFISLNFDQSGNVTACCYNRQYVLGTYPAQSVDEIWMGAPARALRDAFLSGSTAPGCDLCFAQIKSGNFSGALMRNFDRFSVGRPPHRDAAPGPPLVLEFELSNACSLECVMCGGHWSSAIRAKREKLLPVHNPYDARFVDQISALLPSIVMAKFLGGEPFLIPQYHDIWARLGLVNPHAEISITTSGAVVPERPRRLLEQLRAHIVVSLDGVTKETYETIRQNARFETVMANIEDFRAYTTRQGTSLTVACCPMTHNWDELAAVVDFCEARQIGVFFNTVSYPVSSSLSGLSAEGLADVVVRLEEEGQTRRDRWTAQSGMQWQGLVNQLRGWLYYKQGLRWMAERLDDRGVNKGSDGPPASVLRSGDVEESLATWRKIRHSLGRTLSELQRPEDDLVRIRQYVDYIVLDRLGTEWLDDAKASRCVIGGDGALIETVQDLSLAADAMQLFDAATRTTGSSRLQSRLDLVRGAIALGLSDNLLRAVLREADVATVHTFVETAPDEDFARQFSSLQ